MAWIESHQELANHPKTKRLCRVLGIPRVQALGHLHLLWWWSLDYAQDGDLREFASEEIADACDWDGDADQFVMALAEAKFINDDNSVHDWDQYGGKYLKKREQARVRQQRHRNEEGRYESASTRDIPSSHADVTRDTRVSHTVRGQEKTRQDRRGEDQNTKAPAARVRADYTTDFEAFWKRYPSGHGNKKTAAAQWDKLSVEDRRAAETKLGGWLLCDRWKRGMVKAADIWIRDRWWEDPPANDPARGNPTTAQRSFTSAVEGMEDRGDPEGNGAGAGHDRHALLAHGSSGAGAQPGADGVDVADGVGRYVDVEHRVRP